MIWFAAYAASIVAANWAISTFGFVPVGFGLEAPAGVYFAGLAFTFRDLIHRSIGKWWSLVAVGVGVGLSAFVSTDFAVASGVAFGLSELADFLVYTPLWKKRWLVAVAASNAVGLVVDSALFLWLAFGSVDFIEGQIVGKVWVTALAVAVLWVARRYYLAQLCPVHVDPPVKYAALHFAKCPVKPIYRIRRTVPMDPDLERFARR